jgi:class 3 adenylate cyclase
VNVPKIDAHHIETIINLLQSGQALPLTYKYLLFPPPDQETSEGRDFVFLPAPLPDELKGTILVVDDNESNRMLLRDLLEWDGHRVELAANGQQAVEKMRSGSYDLVLLDIMMPELDGYGVLERVRETPSLRYVPIVVISAISDIGSVARCIELGAEDYLFKPIDPVLLQARVSASLEKKRLRDQEQLYLQMLEQERARSERLLLNILPAPIAEQLKQEHTIIADSFDEVTVLFADIVGFTRFSAHIAASELVGFLNEIFSAFDALTARYGLEKIKTIGDRYMVVGGLPIARPGHAEAVASMALDMQQIIRQYKTPEGEAIRLRIGINTGPAVAGVIGTSKFTYDLWGDTVNTASRMEETGVTGRIQVTASAADRLHDRFVLEPRGEIPVKGKGKMPTYFLVGRKET